MKAIIGKKVGMSQIFDEKGHVIPVTVIEAGPCVVTQKQTTEKEGYEAVQLGYEDVAEKKLSKPEVGHLNKAGVSPKKYLREFALDNGSELELGAVIGAGLSANEAVPCVFGILAATDADALSAIKMGVNIGNDTDTIATMVGAIAGAMHGASVFPEEMCKTVVSVNKMDIPAVAKAFTEVFYG